MMNQMNRQQRYEWPSQLQASNPDDAAVLHLAQTLYAEFGGMKDKQAQANAMLNGASAAKNLFNKREYAGLDTDTYLHRRFYAISDPNMMTREAMSGKFSDPEGWKKAMQIAYGTHNGHVKTTDTQFYWTPEERKRQEKTLDFKQLRKVGQDGTYEYWAYKPGALVDAQEVLQKKGYYNGLLDNKDGPMTKAAVTRFQEENGLTPDGIIGPKTKAKLFAKN